ncbi:exosortase system-associated protein, TIGR04073 family [bacterium]|nr:exosortase system-associated protein, TIGR04073 family [bacterium]
MNRIRAAALFIPFFILVLNLSPAECYADNPITKLGRGLANSWTCQYEFTDHVHNDLYYHGPAGLVTGSFKGLFSLIGRAAWGAYDVVTFPIPLPWRYKAPIKPEVNM